MEQTNWLVHLKSQFPLVQFAADSSFRWSPLTQTVYVGPLENQQDLYTLLHETGHALARHRDYSQDIQLLKMEREAWEIARDRIAPLLSLTIPESVVEDALDSYRDWLHARSRCPECSQNGVQQDETHYTCLLCDAAWRVNDARICQLRRYRVATK